MKKAMALFAACVLLTACGASTEQAAATEQANASITADTPETPAVNENPDFRNVSWGMSFDDVKKYEDATFSKENDDERAFYNLEYTNISVMDHTAELGYSFSNGKLSSATYSLKVTETEDYMINNAFFEIADGISAKYGEPEEEVLVIYCGTNIYFEPTNFYPYDNFTFDVTEYNKYSESETNCPIYAIEWTSGNTKIRLDMYIPKNDEGIYTAPDTYEITYSAIDVDNAL